MDTAPAPLPPGSEPPSDLSAYIQKLEEENAYLQSVYQKCEVVVPKLREQKQLLSALIDENNRLHQQQTARLQSELSSARQQLSAMNRTIRILAFLCAACACLCLVFGTARFTEQQHRPSVGIASVVPTATPLPVAVTKAPAQAASSNNYLAQAIVPKSRTTHKPDSSATQFVWVSSSGECYHSKKTCSGMRSPRQVTLAEAKSMGRRPCSKCGPPR